MIGYSENDYSHTIQGQLQGFLHGRFSDQVWQRNKRFGEGSRIIAVLLNP